MKYSALSRYSQCSKLKSGIEKSVWQMLRSSFVVQDIAVFNFPFHFVGRSTGYLHENDKNLRKLTALFRYT